MSGTITHTLRYWMIRRGIRNSDLGTALRHSNLEITSRINTSFIRKLKKNVDEVIAREELDRKALEENFIRILRIEQENLYKDNEVELEWLPLYINAFIVDESFSTSKFANASGLSEETIQRIRLKKIGQPEEKNMQAKIQAVYELTDNDLEKLATYMKIGIIASDGRCISAAVSAPSSVDTPIPPTNYRERRLRKNDSDEHQGTKRHDTKRDGDSRLPPPLHLLPDHIPASFYPSMFGLMPGAPTLFSNPFTRPSPTEIVSSCECPRCYALDTRMVDSSFESKQAVLPPIDTLLHVGGPQLFPLPSLSSLRLPDPNPDLIILACDSTVKR